MKTQMDLGKPTVSIDMLLVDP
eukprot:COSAG06_NODE_2616_length_6576_cov_9.041686_2_plen_21_part_01